MKTLEDFLSELERDNDFDCCGPTINIHLDHGKTARKALEGKE